MVELNFPVPEVRTHLPIIRAFSMMKHETYLCSLQAQLFLVSLKMRMKMLMKSRFMQTIVRAIMIE